MKWMTAAVERNKRWEEENSVNHTVLQRKEVHLFDGVAVMEKL